MHFRSTDMKWAVNWNRKIIAISASNNRHQYLQDSGCCRWLVLISNTSDFEIQFVSPRLWQLLLAPIAVLLWKLGEIGKWIKIQTINMYIGKIRSLLWFIYEISLAQISRHSNQSWKLFNGSIPSLICSFN